MKKIKTYKVSKKQKFKFDPILNLFFGDNNTGKTSNLVNIYTHAENKKLPIIYIDPFHLTELSHYILSLLNDITEFQLCFIIESIINRYREDHNKVSIKDINKGIEILLDDVNMPLWFYYLEIVLTIDKDWIIFINDIDYKFTYSTLFHLRSLLEGTVLYSKYKKQVFATCTNLDLINLFYINNLYMTAKFDSKYYIMQLKDLKEDIEEKQACFSYSDLFKHSTLHQYMKELIKCNKI